MRAAYLALLLAGSASAQAPFRLDDAAVAPKGGVHVEWTNEWASLSKSDLPAQHQYTGVLDVKWGILPDVEVGLDFPVILITGSDMRAAFGFGDLDFAAKAVFLAEKEGSARPAVALAAAVEFPTGNPANGLGSGVTDAAFNVVVDKALGAGFSLTLNLGAVLTGNTLTGAEGLKAGRGAIYVAGLTLKKDVSPDLVVGLVAGGARGDRNVVTDSEFWVQIGAIWSTGRGVSVLASATAGWRESPRAAGLVGVAVDFQ